MMTIKKSTLSFAGLGLAIFVLQATTVWIITTLLEAPTEPSTKLLQNAQITSKPAVTPEQPNVEEQPFFATAQAALAEAEMPPNSEAQTAAETSTTESQALPDPAINTPTILASQPAATTPATPVLAPLTVDQLATAPETAVQSKASVAPPGNTNTIPPKQVNVPQTPHTADPAMDVVVQTTVAISGHHPPTASVQVINPAHSSQLLNSNWINERPPEHYTIQLQTANQPKMLQRYAEHHTLDTPLATYRTYWRKKKRHVHALIMGDYSNHKEALDKVAQLRERFPKLKPWIRSFAAIQREMR